MRIVIALGGNALLHREQALTADNQRHNVKLAAEDIGSRRVAREEHSLAHHNNIMGRFEAELGHG